MSVYHSSDGIMNPGNGLFVVLLGGIGISILYIRSAIKERARRLRKADRELAQFQRAQAKQQRISSAAASPKSPLNLQHGSPLK